MKCISDYFEQETVIGMHIYCTQFLLCDAEWGLKLKQSGDLARNTPLHAAAGCGNLVAVKVLLQFHSDVYAKNCDGNLPIHLAAEQGHCKSV